MRVQFTHDREEMVDALTRLNTRSRTIRGMRRTRTVWVALLSAGVVILLFGFSLRGFIAGAFAALISVLIDPWIFRYEHRKGLRKVIKEKFGEQNSFLCTVELLPEGMKTNSVDIESLTSWETVEEISETKDSVDIFSRMGICVVRDRAFSSADEKQRFINLARQYMHHARSESAL